MEYNVKETNIVRRKLKRVLEEEYEIKVSNKGLYRYIYLFTHHTPQNKVTNMVAATHHCANNIELFAYFIWGDRAIRFNKKKKEK